MLEGWGATDWIKFSVCVLLATQILAHLLKPSFSNRSNSAPLRLGKLPWIFWDETNGYSKSMVAFHKTGSFKKSRCNSHGTIFAEIRRRREEWKSGFSPLGKGGSLSPGNIELARDLLDLFMFWEVNADSGKEWEFTDTEIAQNMVVSLIASHDTTTGTLTGVIYCLATRAHIVQELIEGWVVTLCGRQTHRKEEIFPSPEVFNPSRFDEKFDPYAFIAFGRGPRVCPREKFATIVMEMFLYHFLQRFDYELVNPGEEFTMFFTPRPKNGLPIKL
ncbi:hypothetical protein R1flu_023570 [Riccia fluitans]|uniref:Cytochrome P450 n=1 Tax=Riccia fluitans TaxID=41844 RepID=A0ABD1XWF9_9MARC